MGAKQPGSHPNDGLKWNWITQGRYQKAGLAPGSLVHVGRSTTEPVRVTRTTYNSRRHDFRECPDIDTCLADAGGDGVCWINIDGLHNTQVMERLGQHFDLHPMMLEDVLNTTQRPKSEDFGQHLLVIVKMLNYNEETRSIDIEQVSFVMGPQLVISLQERKGDVFGPVRDRLEHAKGRVRSMGADYLLYALLDAVIDNYFTAFEALGEQMTGIEDEMMDHVRPDTLRRIHQLRRELLRLRRALWPLRDVTSTLERGESKLISKSLNVFFRDTYEHTIQLLDTVETGRELLSSLHDMYLSVSSNRMNEIMKVLTVFAAIFIPLTFVAGVYGMNFEVMPELHWPYGYPLVWTVMLLIAGSMVFFFHRKKWF